MFLNYWSSYIHDMLDCFIRVFYKFVMLNFSHGAVNVRKIITHSYVVGIYTT